MSLIWLDNEVAPLRGLRKSKPLLSRLRLVTWGAVLTLPVVLLAIIKFLDWSK
jgi:hypothetical protein